MYARLSATQFLSAPDTALVEAVAKRIQAFKPAAERLAAWLDDPRRLAMVNEAQQVSDVYLETFGEMAGTALEMNRLAFVSMPELAAEFDGLAKETVRTWTTNLEDTEQETLSRVDTTIRGSIALSGLSLVLGMALAWLIARSIVTPVKKMTDTMTRLAGGDRTVEVEGRSFADEVGEMARAVQIFKDNAIRTKRLGGAAASGAASGPGAAAGHAGLWPTTSKTTSTASSTMLRPRPGEMTATADSMSRRRAGDPARPTRSPTPPSKPRPTCRPWPRRPRSWHLDRRDQPAGRQSSRTIRPGRRRGPPHQQDVKRPVGGRPEDRRRGQADQRHRQPDQPAGAQRHDRGGARRRSRQGLRRRRLAR